MKPQRHVIRDFIVRLVEILAMLLFFYGLTLVAHCRPQTWLAGKSLSSWQEQGNLKQKENRNAR